jgi:hypothetical protein
MALVVKILNCVAWPELFSLFLLCVSIEGRGLRSASDVSTLGKIYVHQMTKNSASVLKEFGLTINTKKTLYCHLTYCISINFNIGKICGCNEARDRDKIVCHHVPHEFFSYF